MVVKNIKMDVSDCIDDYQNDQNNDDYDIDDQNDDDYDDQNDNRNYEWKSTTLLHCRCRNPKKILVRTSLRAEKKNILSFDILDLHKCECGCTWFWAFILCENVEKLSNNVGQIDCWKTLFFMVSGAQLISFILMAVQNMPSALPVM